MPDQYVTDYFNRRLGAMKTERTSFIAHWKELSDYIQPRRGRYTLSDRNKGDRRYQKIINSKATQAHLTARAGMLAGVMSPSRPWFALATQDPGMMEFAPVKNWLYDVERLFRAIYNKSNLYNMAPTMIGELLLFGTGAMTHLDDFDDVARFYTHTVGSYLIAQNSKFQVDTFVREFEMTTEQIIQEFGMDKVSASVKNAYDNGNYDMWFPVVQFIEPNANAKRSGMMSASKPFRSVCYEPGCQDKNKILRLKGFDEFPVYVPRWDLTGEDIYGTDCPAMTALGDVKGLQIEEKRKAQAIDKMVNPPLQGPASLANRPVTSLPGGTNLFDQTGNNQKLEPVYKVEPRIQELMLDIQRVEQRIDKAFYVDMFLAISNMEGVQPKNQLELSQRNQERLLQLGPVLERVHGEFLLKLIDRTFNQCIRAKILPKAPPELQGQPLRVEFVSTLAQAQRAVAVGGIERLAGYIGGLFAAGAQSAWDKFDVDQSIDEYGAMIGVPPRVIVPDDIVAQKRQQQQRMQAQDRMAALAESASKSVKNTADAQTSEPSVLSGMAQRAAGR